MKNKQDKTTVIVSEKNNEEKLFDPIIVAQQIDKISFGVDKLQHGGLNKRAIIALLHDYTGLPKRDIDKMIDGLSNLKKYYTIASL